MGLLSHNKKKTFEQHDNESPSFYRYSVEDISIFNKLDKDIDVDICVIGGGLTGVSSALNLAKKGYKVVLIEARKIGSGASGRNGGQLGIGMRKDQFFLENKLGKNHAKELWNLGIEAVQEVKKYIQEYNINCALKKGVITAGCYPDDSKYFIESIEYMKNNYNFYDYEYLDSKKIKEEINSKNYYSGILNNGSYHLNPLKFLFALVKELLKLNVKVYENTEAKEILETENGVKILTKNNTIKSNYVVTCCNGYIDNLLGKVKNKFMPINNYIIATEPLGKSKARELIKNNYAVCDTRFIIDYYRLSEDSRLLFGGGETFTANFLNNPSKIVYKRMLKVFPNLRNYKIDFYWGGTLAITINRLPNFGTLNNGKILFAQGYSGHGLALSILAGKLISEKISGNNERFNFFESIKHFSIPGGKYLRRPIYSSAIAYYKFRDFF